MTASILCQIVTISIFGCFYSIFASYLIKRYRRTIQCDRDNYKKKLDNTINEKSFSSILEPFETYSSNDYLISTLALEDNNINYKPFSSILEPFETYSSNDYLIATLALEYQHKYQHV